MPKSSLLGELCADWWQYFTHKVRKPSRVTSSQWLCATDAGLRATTNRGWAYFQQPMETQAPIEDWPVIAYTADQGSDTQSAMHCLMSQRVALMKVSDPSHRISNDAGLALAVEGLKPLVHLVSLIMGADQGPWGEGRWHQSMKDSTERYLQVADPSSCPIFQDLLPKVALDLSETDSFNDDEWRQAVWDLLQEAYQHRELRALGTRWFDFVDRASLFVRKWHLKLILLTYHMISSGIFERSANVSILQNNPGRPTTEQAPAGTPQESGSTSHIGAMERDLRRRCANQLQLQAVVMSDFDVYQLVRICSVGLEEVRLYHGLQNKENRSVKEVREWYTSQACGDIITHLVETAKVLDSPSRIEVTGMWVPGWPRQDASAPIQGELHQWVIHEDWLANRLGGLVVAVISRRFLSASWSTMQLPGKLAGLLDEARRDEVMAWIVSANEAWKGAERQSSNWWVVAKKLSSWIHLVVVKVVSCGGLGGSPALVGPTTEHDSTHLCVYSLPLEGHSVPSLAKSGIRFRNRPGHLRNP